MKFFERKKKPVRHALNTRQKVAEALARLLFEREEELRLDRLRHPEEGRDGE